VTRASSKTAADAVFHFFGGKGGVGKTTCAAAYAIAAARRRRTLVISVDPAHSLGDALGRKLGVTPRGVRLPGGGRLDAVELDADASLRRWRQRHAATLETIALGGTYLDEEDVESFLRLSVPGVDELFGLVEIVRLGRAGAYGETVVDTAPTGHALRLLETPETLGSLAAALDAMQAKRRAVADALGAASVGDEADALVEWLRDAATELIALLRDPVRCRFTWVALPEPVAVAEAIRGVQALGRLGIDVAEIIVNRVTPPSRGTCRTCATRRALEERAIDTLAHSVRVRRLRRLSAFASEPRGIRALTEIGEWIASGRSAGPGRRRAFTADIRRAPAGGDVVRSVPAAAEEHLPSSVRLFLVCGKGGVGKTTAACALALRAARVRPRDRVLLLSIDPAHSLGDALGTPIGDRERSVPGGPANLRLRELDARLSFERQREGFGEAADRLFDRLRGGSALDAVYDREVVRRLLEFAPPGLDELAAIAAVVDALVPDRASQTAPCDLIVADTAPTGHALRLLQMPGVALDWIHALLAVMLKYRPIVGLGQMAAELTRLAGGLRRLRALLVDPRATRALVVTRAGVLPTAETSRLLRGLRRLGIDVPTVLVNAIGDSACPRCSAPDEVSAISAVRRVCGPRRVPRCAIIVAPVEVPPPRGPEALAAWGGRWRRLDG
jgi:arsenite-transporting ATPase